MHQIKSIITDKLILIRVFQGFCELGFMPEILDVK